jgi:hypothetical protein
MDLSAEEAAALLDSGTEPAILVQTLGDYRQSEQVQLQGCRRIAAALTAVASNQTAKESLLSSFSEAGAAVALVESLRWHTTEGKAGADLAAAMCESLGTLLAGPPNHAPPGDEWWRNDASCSSAMRLASARAGALHLALDVVRAHADAALEAADHAAPPVCAVAGAYLVLERLMMEHENKLVFSETGALTQLVEQLKAFKQHARMVESIMAVLMNSACAHDDNKLAIAAAGAVGHVVEVMDAHALDPGVQARACGLFCNLAAEQTTEAEDERLQVRIASAGAVSRIAGAMEAHADDAAVQEEACAAFMNLARNNADNRNLIRAAGGEQLARKVCLRMPSTRVLSLCLLSLSLSLSLPPPPSPPLLSLSFSLSPSPNLFLTSMRAHAHTGVEGTSKSRQRGALCAVVHRAPGCPLISRFASPPSGCHSCHGLR